MAESSGMIPVGIVNRKRGLGAYQVHRTDQFAHHGVWKNLGEGTYVVSLEPTTNWSWSPTIHDFGVASASPSEGVDYPDVARDVAEAVSRGEEERAILVCGTGIGMAITANKVPGVRAAQAHDVYSAQRARKSNDAQILALGARVIGLELAKSIVDAWLESEFAGGASAHKVEKIKRVDADYRSSATRPASR